MSIELTDELIDSLKLLPLDTQSKPEKKLDPFRESIVKISVDITNFVNKCVTLQLDETMNLGAQKKFKIRKIFEEGMEQILKYSDHRLADAISNKLLMDKMRKKMMEDLD